MSEIEYKTCPARKSENNANLEVQVLFVFETGDLLSYESRNSKFLFNMLLPSVEL